jgi:hypothetical protein
MNNTEKKEIKKLKNNKQKLAYNNKEFEAYSISFRQYYEHLELLSDTRAFFISVLRMTYDDYCQMIFVKYYHFKNDDYSRKCFDNYLHFTETEYTMFANFIKKYNIERLNNYKYKYICQKNTNVDIMFSSDFTQLTNSVFNIEYSTGFNANTITYYFFPHRKIYSSEITNKKLMNEWYFNENKNKQKKNNEKNKSNNNGTLVTAFFMLKTTKHLKTSQNILKHLKTS